MDLYTLAKEHAKRLGLSDDAMLQVVCDHISPYGTEAPRGQAFQEALESIEVGDIDL